MKVKCLFSKNAGLGITTKPFKKSTRTGAFFITSQFYIVQSGSIVIFGFLAILFLLSFDRKKIPLYKRALSFFRPVWLKNEVGFTNPHLELLLYRDRIQLATGDALYSDGAYYTPALSVLDYLKPFLPEVKKMLVMGVGLGSTVQIMEKRGYEPSFTLVELDKVVLRMAVEFLASSTTAKLNPICEDAKVFIEQTEDKFDLIFVDIFDSREVPSFATSSEFLSKCKERLNPGGRLALNYIINDMMNWNETQINFSMVFPKHHLVKNSINRIFITD